MAKQTILVVDDHPAWFDILRFGLRQTPDLVVQGRVGSKGEALAALAEDPADVVVLDVVLSDGCGLGLCREVTERGWPASVLILSGYDQDAYLARAWAGGAAGYLLKSEEARTIADAVRRVSQGEALWTPYQELRVQHWQRAAGDKWAALTGREREVVAALARFNTDAEIAERLKISPNTVHRHVAHILAKLKLGNRRDVADWALRYKLVEL